MSEHPRASAERRIVAQLGEAMLAKLAQRREHGEWSESKPLDLLDCVESEFGELERALLHATGRMTPENRDAVIAEAADVANYLAMLVDVLSREGE